MGRKKSTKSGRPLEPVNQQSVQNTKLHIHKNFANDEDAGTSSKDLSTQSVEYLHVRPLLDDENSAPGPSWKVNGLNTDTRALQKELDTFRQKWKRDLKLEWEGTPELIKQSSHDQPSDENPLKDEDKSSSLVKESVDANYSEAKRLFLKAVELEQDGLHHESIRYYKPAIHLCPDIEKQIFKEQCEASAREAALANTIETTNSSGNRIHKEHGDTLTPSEQDKIELFQRIRQNYDEECLNKGFIHCQPTAKQKQDVLHISDLPQEIILLIFRYVVGEDLDLASLESVGTTCRGFYLLSKNPSLWGSICLNTWGKETLSNGKIKDEFKTPNCSAGIADELDWRRMFVERPRINYDGVYISRTRYIRQGDVGFQDIHYRPFHVIRYYRYLRFFPDRRVLILTTNEEPDKIIPIFRHALHAKQFSSELSILEGNFEYITPKQISVTAEKDCRSSTNLAVSSQKRQAQFHWSRQTPLTQKFNMRFELKTVETRPYRNNTLKWIDYSILTRHETSQEVTTFDLCPETFPSLLFSRVKRFNLKLVRPLI